MKAEKRYSVDFGECVGEVIAELTGTALPCIFCQKPLANFHGSFARCSGGKTQYTNVPMALREKISKVTEDGEFGGYHA